MAKTLEELMKDFESIKNQITDKLKESTESEVYIKRFTSKHWKYIEPLPSAKDNYRIFIKRDDPHYYLVTLTFSPNVSMHYDEFGQKKKLIKCVRTLDNHHYFACLEKHKSGVLHAHIMIRCDDHKIQCKLHEMKKELTNSPQLHPAITVKPVNNGEDHLNRTYNYIWDNKDDHPVYKHIMVNI